MQSYKPVHLPMRLLYCLFAALFSISLSSCSKDEKDEAAPIDDGNTVVNYQIPAGFPYPAFPADNAPTINRIELGKKLFNDVILSQNNTISCSSCHRENSAFIDGFRVSTGISNHVGTRNAISAINSAYLPALLWDGKYSTLEEQSIGPIENTKEMGSDVNAILVKLQNDATYTALFQQAYGEGPTLSTLKRAIACFERSLYSAPSKFDRNMLSASELNGKSLFFGKANCSNCHSGFMFSDFTYQNTGRFTTYADSGRAFITLNPADLAKFRVPPLRNIAATAPFMHDGKVNTLEDVVNFYNSGGVAHPNKNPIIQPLNLTTQEKLDLVNFLKAI